ncbi:MAG: hypothetical protein ACOX7K_04415 [Oscillospiraceae bacterium]|jgi:hypothetical protein
MNKNSKFVRGKFATILLLAAAIGVCILSIVYCEEGSTQMLMMTILSLALLAAAFWVCIRFCKCPYCGKTIFSKVLTAQYCPHCNRDLSTGAKKLEYDTLKEHVWSRNNRGGKKR